MSRKLISKDSVQGAFTKKYYTDESQLDRELADTLPDIVPETLKGQREGKSERYPVGTVVRLDPCGRRAYFVAIADMNEHGVAVSSFDMLKISLAELWVYIGSRGLKEPLVMPVLGTGSSRLTQPRDDVVREDRKIVCGGLLRESFHRTPYDRSFTQRRGEAPDIAR